MKNPFNKSKEIDTTTPKTTDNSVKADDELDAYVSAAIAAVKGTNLFSNGTGSASYSNRSSTPVPSSSSTFTPYIPVAPCATSSFTRNPYFSALPYRELDSVSIDMVPPYSDSDKMILSLPESAIETMQIEANPTSAGTHLRIILNSNGVRLLESVSDQLSSAHKKCASPYASEPDNDPVNDEVDRVSDLPLSVEEICSAYAIYLYQVAVNGPVLVSIDEAGSDSQNVYFMYTFNDEHYRLNVSKHLKEYRGNMTVFSLLKMFHLMYTDLADQMTKLSKTVHINPFDGRLDDES